MSPVAIVTASDSGIGQESAKELAENGFDLGITYRTDEAGAQETLEAVRAAGRRGEVRRLDLTELPGAADGIDHLADSLGGVDVLVNNAGTGDPTGEFLELPYEEWRQVIDTNLSGAFLCAQRAARRMVDAGNGGRIINITSVHEHIPRTGASAYCASKGGLGLLTKVMAMELAEYGILVNAVGPGEISTPMTGAEDEDRRKALEVLAVELDTSERAGQAEEAAPGGVRARVLRLAVAVGVGVGITVGAHRILAGDPLHVYMIGGYGLVILLTLMAPPGIVALAFDLGGVTTSEITVPVVTALGIGLATGVAGPDPLIDGFGLIAFASMCPVLTVLGYAIIQDRLQRRIR